MITSSGEHNAVSKARTIVVRRRRIRKQRHHNSSWKIAYADFVTAMMAFFMLLWLLSNPSKISLDGLADYFSSTPASIENTAGANAVFGGEMVGRSGNGQSGSKSPGLRFDPQNGAEARVKQEGKSNRRGEADRPDVTQRVVADELRLALFQSPEASQLKNQIRVSSNRDGIRISLMDSADRPMFRTGTAELYPYARNALVAVASQLLHGSFRLAIEGHTDSIGGLNDTNWRVSGDRAQAARRVMLGAGISADRIAEVVALAGTQPIFPDKPDRPENRRIAIVVLSEAAAHPQDVSFRR